MYEVEQKYRVSDPAVVLDRLSALGAGCDAGTEQVDRYFRHPCRDFSQTDEALRVRRIGESNFVTYKGPKIDRTTKTRRELELPLPHGADFASEFGQLLTLLGFEFVAEVRKVRRKALVDWQGGTVEVAVDKVVDVGNFVELEIMSDEAELDDARNRLATLGATLELDEVERRSYLELLLGDASSA